MLSLESWLQKLGIQGVNKTLINTALTHSSFKGMGGNKLDYERLEFLGDAVLDLISANLLYDNKSLTEAQMTELRKKYVSNNELAKIFNRLETKNYINTAKNLQLSNKTKADFIEALFGAVFIDKGYPMCLKLWGAIQKGLNNNSKAQKKPQPKSTSASKKQKAVLKNAKSILGEFCQDNSFSAPDYKLLKKQGPEHNPTFTARVTISAGGNSSTFRSKLKLKANQKLSVFSDGTGKKIKTAEMSAAQKLCSRLGLKYSK